jgi:hypothetical protein
MDTAMSQASLPPGQRYDMPPSFGPSVAPDVEHGFDLHGSTIEFATAREAVAPLMPRWFKPDTEPLVAIGYRHMIGMDWMGGRNYRLITVRISAQIEIDGVETPLPFTPVIWESDYAPVVSGRELMGAPKLLGDIPEVPEVGIDHDFVCREYDARLFEGRVTELQELPEQAVARTNAAQDENAFSVGYWKVIPGPGDITDADYPVGIRMTTPFQRMWKGRGELHWERPQRHEAPYSSRIIETLRALPCLSDVRASAFHAAGCTLYRNRSRRLDIPQ